MQSYANASNGMFLRQESSWLARRLCGIEVLSIRRGELWTWGAIYVSLKKVAIKLIMMAGEIERCCAGNSGYQYGFQNHRRNPKGGSGNGQYEAILLVWHLSWP